MIEKTIIKKLISKNGYFERELLIELMQPKRLKRFLVKKFYKKFLRIGFESPAKANATPQKPKINALERIGYCFEPIGLRSKLTAKFKQLTR